MNSKLIRDKIPEIIIKSGKTPKIHISNNEEHWTRLKNKLLEEVNEFLDDESIEELADINEVLHAIYDYKKISKEEVEKVRKNKKNQRGGFKKRIILDEII